MEFTSELLQFLAGKLSLRLWLHKLLLLTLKLVLLASSSSQADLDFRSEFSLLNLFILSELD